MQHNISDRNILDKFCTDFCQIVEKYCKYIVVSGFVAIASGRTRGTEDIDMITERISESTFIKLFNELSENFFECMQGSNPKELYSDYLLTNLNIRFTRKGERLPEMEFKLSKDLLDTYQLKSKTKLPLTGLDIWFSNINVNIAFKEELLKAPKDLEDARHLRIVFSELVNLEEIEQVKLLIKRFRL